MEQLPAEINVVTLNCWGLRFVSKLRNERLTEIGRQLAVAEPTPDIVGLQECFSQEDYTSIRRETRFVLPYGKFYHSGPFGAGLAILSKWPIEESNMIPYSLNGRPTAFWRGDWYVGKGIAHAKIRFGPRRHIVEVFNTHTHAPYEHSKPFDTYLCHRISQSWEYAKALRNALDRGHPTLGLGDFNMHPLSVEHRLITAHAPVRDVWRVLHPDSSLGPAHEPLEQARRRPIPTAGFNVAENGATSDSVYNTWRWEGKRQKQLGRGGDPMAVPPDAVDPRGQRLDYVFAGDGDALGWEVLDARVGMTMRHPELQCSLSDHFSAEATLALRPRTHLPIALPPRALTPTAVATAVAAAVAAAGAGAGDPGLLLPPRAPFNSADAATEVDVETTNDEVVTGGAYLQSPTGSEHRPSGAWERPPWAEQEDGTGPARLPGSTYDEILQAIHRYAAREQGEKRWRGWHFGAWVGLTLACYVAVWFSPNFVAFILMLLSSLGLAAGTVDGLLSLLFFKSEIRALKEFEWEIRNAKDVAAGDYFGPPLSQEGHEKGW